MGLFQPGDPKPPNSGRKPGQRNRHTILLKDALVEAASTTKAGDLTDYLRLMAFEQPASFLALLGRVIPLQVDAALTHNVQITKVTRVIIDALEPEEESLALEDTTVPGMRNGGGSQEHS